MATSVKVTTIDGIDVSDFDVVETDEGAWVHTRCAFRAITRGSLDEVSHGVYVDEVDDGDECHICGKALPAEEEG